MKFVQFLKLLFASLILLAYQSHTTHFQHFLEKKSDCETCVSEVESINFSQSLSFLFENSNLETTQYPKEITKTPKKIYHDFVAIVWIDFKDLYDCYLKPIPVGYDANAPPSVYS